MIYIVKIPKHWVSIVVECERILYCTCNFKIYLQYAKSSLIKMTTEKDIESLIKH